MRVFVVKVLVASPFRTIFFHKTIPYVVAIKLKLLDDVSFDVRPPTLYEKVIHEFQDPAHQKDARDMHIIILLKLVDQIQIFVSVLPVQLTQQHFVNVEDERDYL